MSNTSTAHNAYLVIHIDAFATPRRNPTGSYTSNLSDVSIFNTLALGKIPGSIEYSLGSC